MKFKPHEFFKKHPELEEIAIRLDESEKDAKLKNEEMTKKKKSGTLSEGNLNESAKVIFQYRPECGVISNFYKDGRWEQTPYTPKSGRDPFLKDLAKVLESRDPDAIKVEIYKGKTKKKTAVYSKDIYLVTNQAEIKESSNELGCPENFETSIEKLRAKVSPSNFEIEMLRKDFDAKLKEQQHASEIKELKLEHQNEINTLQASIKEKEEIIESLEEDLNDYEGHLEGLQEEKEKPFGEVLIGRVLMTAGENILKNNPRLLKIGLGITDDEIKKIWESSSKKIEEKREPDNSSFSEASPSNEFQGLDPKHAEGIRELNDFFKQISLVEFRKLYTISLIMQDPTNGKFNNELADKVLLFIKEKSGSANQETSKTNGDHI